MLNKSDLHDYQVRTVEFIKEKKRVCAWLDLGLGKTISTLTAITDLLDQFAVSKVLVIAPLRVANSVWAQEAVNWQHTKHLTVSVCTGTDRERRSALMRTSDIYVINRENVKWLVDLYGDKWPFDCVVIDEASSFKSAKSQRFKALKKILHLTDYMITLTGTPAPNGLMDLWAQVYLVDFGKSLGRTATGFRNRFFEQTGYMGYTYTPRKDSDKKIHQLIEPFTLSMTADDYLELPERIDITEKCYLPPKVMKDYLEFEKELLIEVEDEVIEAMSAAVLANKLLQWCNGFIYKDEFKNWAELHKVKLDALADIVEDNAGENILVAYNYKTDLERLTEKFPQAVVLDKDPDTIKRWNMGEIPMMLAHPASAGHGLNLQRGGALIVWFGLNWSLELYQQFNARLYRQGQDMPVRIIHLVIDGCMDERVMSVLSSKDVTQAALINALKRD